MIDRYFAIATARKHALKNGWAFSEPVKVVYRRGLFGRGGRFEIETRAESCGTRARFVVDERTGEMISEGYITR